MLRFYGGVIKLKNKGRFTDIKEKKGVYYM